ncbi:hypothetical protein ACFS5M_07865 [Lacinutrix iliipiscaria]|uniref:Histidine kinase n=1 Tax=Lacinutrix iliipiscaria TaxID=1230532 RepID=A0ABW5WPM9_9FLAO
MSLLLNKIKQLKTKDVIITISIVALPFLFFIYKLATRTQEWKTKLFLIDSGNWDDVYFYLWMINVKLLIIIMLIIWYGTCKHWWRKVILVPLILELFKLRSFFDKSTVHIDEIEFLQSLPITIPIIIFIIFLTKKMGYFSKYSDLHNELNQEIEQIIEVLNLIKQEEIVFFKKELKYIKSKKSILSLNEYNNKLLNLRKRLTDDL